MKKIYTVLFSICILFSSITAMAQNVAFEKKNFPNRKEEFKRAKKAIKEAEIFYEQGGARLKHALENYLIANDFNPNNASLNYRIGRCYIDGREKAKSLPYFLKAMELDPFVTEDLYLMIGRAYHQNYQWDKAIEYFKKYKDIPEISDYAPIDRMIQECMNGKELQKKPSRVFIDNMGEVINSSYDDHSPVISADETILMYTSKRPGTTGGEQDPRDFEYFEDIYYSQNTNGTWATPTNPGKPLNTDNHDATVGISNDGQTLFIYKGEERGGDIYECKLDGDLWKKPDCMSKHINTKFHEPSASLSPDGRTVYFVSNREDGIGGEDIYMSQMNRKGKWEEAVNLGDLINTPYDEGSVFIHPDGKTLYFSSKGHNSMGGYDIFKTVFENGQWTKPENLGYPINSPGNDISFVLSASGLHGYFSSIREGGVGGMDIYMITFLGKEKPVVYNSEDNLIASITKPTSSTVIEPVVEITSGQLTILKGVISDAVTNTPLLAKIELVDNEANEVIATFESNSKSGKYLVSLPAGKNYGITVKAENYLFHSENFVIPETAGYSEVVKDIALNKIVIGSKIVLNNIFFDFDKATITKASTAELENLAKLLIEYPSLKIEISGHTDDKGSDAYNQRLSENRAKAVVDYLVNKKGIEASRLSYKGYGETAPIAPNDTEEGRQMNRRTEFKIVSK